MSVLAISILCVSHLAVSNSLWLLWIAAYQVPLSWNSPGKNTRVRSHFLLQGIFLTQGSHAVSRIAGQLFTSWATTEAPIILEWIATELGSHSLLESTKNDSKFKTRTYGQAPSQIPYSCFPLSSVAQSLPTLCKPKDFNMPDFPVHRQLPEFAHTHVHRVGDAIQPSLLLSPSPPALNLSQHQGLFQWVSSSHQVAKTLEFQLQHQSFQWIFRTDFR